MDRWRPKAIALLCAALAGCSLHQVQDQAPLPENAPAAFSEPGQVVAPTRWWTAFGDESLDRLVDEGLTDNLGLAAAWARLRQFDALARQAGAALWPEVIADASARRAKTVFGGQSETANQLALGLSASYEVDLWRRLSSTSKAAALDRHASRADLDSIALTLTANIARAWYAIAEQRELLALLDDQIAVNKNFLEVIETRFANGLATAVEVYQQREQLAATRAQVPTAQAQLEVSERQLAVLLGKPPTAFVEGDRAPLPQLPEVPKTGLPVALFGARPDLRRAQNQLVAADYRLAAAIAAQYPSLRLTGEAGYQAADLEDLFDDWIWNLAGNLLQPLFDKGRRQAEADRNRAVVEERLAVLENVFIIAVQEVEDALARERHQRELIARLDDQLTHAASALLAGKARYLRGVGDYLTVLTEIQAVQRAERALITARGALVNNRVGLYQALGGGDWTADLKPVAERRPNAGAPQE